MGRRAKNKTHEEIKAQKHKHNQSWYLKRKASDNPVHTSEGMPMVYVARSKYRPGHLKIGRTANPTHRLKMYHTADRSMEYVWQFPCVNCAAMEHKIQEAVKESFDLVEDELEWFDVSSENEGLLYMIIMKTMLQHAEEY